ncbi:AAA family ATPase [Telmatospirillum siberiense]|uniref:Cytidylate kinase-like family protein n=1 Tax=Telmatospirillum siberiense TaxID=382514 RepID=A0A2N3PQ71_9PROT|nr:cytidylate kinase-like family protein [Telmatospirillum siberiense]PKU22551.1 cytidylate kinase-like family protein [Telmatospirillum siberiense]
MPDVQEAIQAIVSTINTSDGSRLVSPERPVVCISRDCGTGGDEVARLLAERLGVDVYDRIIVERISQRLDAEPETMRALDAGASHLRDLWLYSLVTGQNLNADHYKRHLINVIVSIGRSGGVILGRGAHLILANSGALRVRITGSHDICARRIAETEGIDIEAARKRVEEVNHHRGKFVWDHFQERSNDPRTFDLIINTDHISDLQKVVDMLIDAMKMIRPPVPQPV